MYIEDSKRNFGFMSMLAFSCTVMITWEAVLLWVIMALLSMKRKQRKLIANAVFSLLALPTAALLGQFMDSY